MSTTATVAEVFSRLYDDAAIFPPGSMPLDKAVSAHLAHQAARHGALVGSLVVGVADLPELEELTCGLPPASLELAVTAPTPTAAGDAREAVRRIRAAQLVGLEVALPADLPAAEVVPALRRTVGEPAGVAVYVELPRDHRRAELWGELARSPYLAKLRTGGVRADLHPDEAELGAAITAAVRHGVPFKATAGLHHAVRTTDPLTGFEQHGYLNVLVATDAALRGADEAAVLAHLAERDGSRIAARTQSASPRTREMFRSFGTCEIAEPAVELATLGLLDRDLVRGLR